MKTHYTQVLIIALLIMLPTSSIAFHEPNMPYQKQSTIPEWYDGEFNGTIKKVNDDTIGSLSGFITYGRSDTKGSFIANIELMNSSQTASGIFFHTHLIGYLHSNNQTLPLIGRITYNRYTFSANLWAPLRGLYSINCSYTGSFLLPPTGDYAIGVKTYHLIDTSRPENFTQDPDDYREMMVQVWYPVEPTEELYQTPAAPYMDPFTFQWLKGRSPIPLITIPDTAHTFVHPHGFVSPEIATSSQPFPLILFSHGYDGVYQIYTSLIEELVTNGYVIVSINHPYIAGITVFPGNRTVNVSVIPSDPQQREAWLQLGQRSVVDDAKFVLDFVQELNNSDPMFAGRFDTSHVGMYGHSFGGGATAICCYEDNRFTAGLTLDGFFSSENIAGGMSAPFLMMVTGGRFLSDTSLTYIWENLSDDAYLVGINGSQHYSFTDVGVLLRHLVPLIPARLLGFGEIDQKRMVNLTVKVERAFFDVYLKHVPNNVLDETLSMFPEIQYIKK